MDHVILDKKTRDFTDLYNDYYAVVYSAVYAKIGNTHEAKDICQEVFTRYYEKFDQVENPRKWLLGTLRRVVLEFYRNKRGQDLKENEVFEDLALTFVNGFRDTRIMIEDALNSLDTCDDHSERIVFELIAIDNFSYKQVGEELGITDHQARYKYEKIISRLVKYFNDRGIKNLEDLL